MVKRLIACGRWDLNPHARRHRNLNPACLPISPLPRVRSVYGEGWADPERLLPLDAEEEVAGGTDPIDEQHGPPDELAPVDLAVGPVPEVPRREKGERGLHDAGHGHSGLLGRGQLAVPVR